jgi:hypothetical protein
LSDALIEAIKIGLDKLRVRIGQKGENVNLTTNTIAALNEARIMLEKLQSCS